MNRKAIFAGLMSGLLASASASALVIDDHYAGAIDRDFVTYDLARDVLGDGGNESLYQVYGMEVTSQGSQLTVSIRTAFTADATDNYGDFQLGDLFISDDGWNPAGDSSNWYAGDNAANGEDWEYAFISDVDNPRLLAIEESDILVLGPDDCCREGQEVLATGGDEVAGAAVSFNRQEGEIDPNTGRLIYRYQYVFDYSMLGLIVGDTIGLHWTMTCGNDVIEGAYQIQASVPEPGAVLLMALGLIGLVVSRRRVMTHNS